MDSGPDYWPWWAGPDNLFPSVNPGNGDRGFAAFGNGARNGEVVMHSNQEFAVGVPAALMTWTIT
jgi:hypothetical protein